MALSATIYKIDLRISDLDRHYYQDHALTLALHPSETIQRMMVRLLAFTLNASDQLEFTRGLSSTDEPDLWQKTARGEIELLIQLGQPSFKRVKKACNQSTIVKIYAYSRQRTNVWWQQNMAVFTKLANLRVISLPEESITCLDSLVSRNMQLQCTIQDGFIWFGDERTSCEISPVTLL